MRSALVDAFDYGVGELIGVVPPVEPVPPAGVVRGIVVLLRAGVFSGAIVLLPPAPVPGPVPDGVEVPPPQALKTKTNTIAAPTVNCHRFFIMLKILPFVY